MKTYRLVVGTALTIIAMMAWLFFPQPAQAERDWEFSVAAFGGKAFHSNEDVKQDCGGCNPFFFATLHRVNLNDSPMFGAKLTTWYLPRKYDWQPQIGLELDFTRFTADVHPQQVPASGTINIPGMEIVGANVTAVRDFGVNVLALNLLFRYPIWANPRLTSRSILSLRWSRPRGPTRSSDPGRNHAPANGLLPRDPRYCRSEVLPDQESRGVWGMETDNRVPSIHVWLIRHRRV